jgi:hypothetical protein
MTDLQDLLRHALAAWPDVSGFAAAAARILGITIGAWVLIGLAQRSIRALRVRIANRMDDREAVKRAETLGRVFRYLAAVVISLMAGMLVLSEFGVSVAPILGAAGWWDWPWASVRKVWSRISSPGSSSCWRTRSGKATSSDSANTPGSSRR